METMDTRTLALTLGRSRAVVGIVLLLLPGLAGRLWLRPSARGAGARFFCRLTGIRDLLLGVGSVIAVKEGRKGADWLAMGGVADVADAAAVLVSPGVRRSTRMAALAVAAFGAANLKVAQMVADEASAAGEPAA
ncbi:MAG: hypothetical protein M5U14_14655 [Acidimicrobiia bacterium]|nr:hypothetical protein [Acidimicrobiia bacterium]